MDSYSITEKRDKHVGSIRIGRSGLDWIIACLVELLPVGILANNNFSKGFMRIIKFWSVLVGQIRGYVCGI